MNLCKKLLLCFLACLLCSCSSQKHSVRTTTRIETDSLVQVQVQRDTIYWHGTTITKEKVSVTVSRWDAESNQWQPETKTDTNRNIAEENKDTINVSDEHTITEGQKHVEQKQQEKVIEQKGVRWNVLDVVACILGILVLLVMLFAPKNRLK